MSNPLLHKIEQTAERLQRSPRKVHYLIAEGELEVVHDGRSVRVVVASEDAYVERLRQRETVRRAAKVAATPERDTATPSPRVSANHLRNPKHL